MKGIIFRTAKAAFRKAYRKHKSQVKKATQNTKRGIRGTGIEPYDLIKADIKRKIRGTKFTAAAEFKAQPGLKRRIRVGIERAKREKKKFRKPVIFGKAYASDKKGKTMQIQPLTLNQRKQMKKEMAKSADREYKRVRMRKFGYSDGGIKKMLVGGLLTKGIKAAAKKYFKHSRKTKDILKNEGGSRAQAKADVKSGIRDEIKPKFQKIDKQFQNNKSDDLIRMKRRLIIRDMNLLK